MFAATCSLNQVELSWCDERPPLPCRQPCSQATEPTKVHEDSAVTGLWACDLHSPSLSFASA